MLIDFKVENFLSFTKRTSFSMVPSESKEKANHIYNINDLSLLRFGAIFGANSSGKSNFLKAISFTKDIILNNNHLIKGKNRFSKITKGNDKKESVFEFTLLINNKVYTYGFSSILSEARFSEEWIYLHDIKEDKEILLFERCISEGKFNFYFNDDEDLEMIKMANYQNDFANNDKILFLSEMNKNKTLIKNTSLSAFKDIYEWINDKLSIITFDMSVYIYHNFNTSVYQRLIKHFDVGIKELILNKISEDEFRVRVKDENIDYINNNIKNDENILIKSNDFLLCISKTKNEFEYFNVLLKHDKSEYLFEFVDESDGSKRLFDYIHLLTCKDKEAVYIIDEISKSLHPLLIRRFIELFTKHKLDSQLIFSSHDPSLLNLLRSDEIWLVERQKDDSSRIYSLDNFNVNHSSLNNDYLKGKYGGIPYLLQGLDNDD